MIRHRKSAAQKYLEVRDFESLQEWAEGERGSVRILMSLILDVDPLVRWRAIEGLGQVCRRKSKQDLKFVRRIIRRLFWGMNDESGNLIWSAPEAIAEILVNVPKLVNDYAPLLPSLIDLEPFPRGVSWALARISAVKPEIFSEAADVLLKSLSSPDPLIRGCSIRVLGHMRIKEAEERIRILLNDHEEYEIYDTDPGEMRKVRISDDCERALQQLRSI